jgi:anti-sigma28 factor (negative regulator of flagellin synthesis)
MENTILKKNPCDCLVEREVEKRRRPRSLTTLKMEWLAERVRKVKRIKEEIEQGTYSVDSREVAKAMLRFRFRESE